MYFKICCLKCVMMCQPQGAYGPASAEEARARVGGQHMEGLQHTRGEDQRVRGFKIFCVTLKS